jgi:hypothetical protein
VSTSATRKGEEEPLAKTTVELPKSFLKALKLKIIERDERMGHVTLEALKLWISLRSRLTFDRAYQEATWRVQISDDPEDVLELSLSINDMLVLHKSVHDALVKAGVKVPDETKDQS